MGTGTTPHPSAGGSLLPNEDATITGQWSHSNLTVGLRTAKLDGSVLAIPPVRGTWLITKATAGAFTLAAPATTIDGDVLVISSETAAAHTVTGVGLLADGASGSPHGTATYAAYKGASLVLMAANQLWNVLANNNVTIA